MSTTVKTSSQFQLYFGLNCRSKKDKKFLYEGFPWELHTIRNYLISVYEKTKSIKKTLDIFMELVNDNDGLTSLRILWMVSKRNFPTPDGSPNENDPICYLIPYPDLMQIDNKPTSIDEDTSIDPVIEDVTDQYCLSSPYDLDLNIDTSCLKNNNCQQKSNHRDMISGINLPKPNTIYDLFDIDELDYDLY